MNFNEAVNIVLDFEQGYSDDPTDKGGETKYGISKRQYPNVDIKNLTIFDAKEIYYKDYWSKLFCPQIKNPEIRLEIFDFGVNAGVEKSTECMQKALNLIGEPVITDKRMGHFTMSAINRATKTYPTALMSAFRGYQFMHYLGIVTRTPKQRKFIRGWLTRI